MIKDIKKADFMDNCKKKFSLSKVIFSIWSILILFLLWRTREDVFSRQERYVRLIVLAWIIAISGEIILFKSFWEKWNDKKKGYMLFLIALVVRLFFLKYAQYIPTSDFTNYFNGACHFAEGGFKAGVYNGLEAYEGIPTFAGQAIINGLFLRILSPTLLGMQILNGIYTAGLCLLIYLLGKNVNSKVAVIASILYTFYPSSILSTQITSNHHGAAFFILLGVFLFSLGVNYKKASKKILFLVLSATCLVMSNYYHPSIVIMLCAFIAYVTTYEISVFIRKPKLFFPLLWDDIKHMKGIFVSVIIVLFVYIIASRGTLSIMKIGGYVKSEPSNPIGKIVVGLNYESGGKRSKEDDDMLRAIPVEERDKAMVELIKERLLEKDLVEIVAFFGEKTENAWFGTDNYFYFYGYGWNNKLEEMIGEAVDPAVKTTYEEEQDDFKKIVTYDLCYADRIIVYFFWMLALIGMLSIIKKYEDDNIIYLCMYLPLGWMLFIMISELQSRYRYQSMPIIILLAGFGLQAIREKANDICKKLVIKKRENL